MTNCDDIEYLLSKGKQTSLRLVRCGLSLKFAVFIKLESVVQPRNFISIPTSQLLFLLKKDTSVSNEPTSQFKFSSR